jgi:exopolyphosphatase/guanosine-5'-triphosphate,3'-diphosphate pyrophosphatase
VTALTTHLGDDQTLADVDGQQHVIPLGVVNLSRTELVSDPPRPEELTNAIGLVTDYLDDMIREVPAAGEPDHVTIVGDPAIAIAAIEVGDTPSLPLTLSRAAVEEVFRTVATESSAERALNPGLPADLVDTIVAACCIVVAIMRYLHLDAVEFGGPT